MLLEFTEIVTSEEQLREVLGFPLPRTVAKTITALDQHCRAFIAKSPFMLMASADANGNMDVSPKGDPPGFVQVLDDHTLAIPDRLGNRRADTFTNLLQNPNIGLLFLVPGKQETLRVNGTAKIVRDLWLRERMVMQGKIPDFALVVTVKEAFLHCAKCVIRSKVWDAQHWPDIETLPSLAHMLIDHAKLTDKVEDLQAVIDQNYKDKLY
jgi:PPOX class probable FMN-dependent enzyme